ncbi:MAG: hypothetical protein HZB26_26070, partial [Candidatus Hydrogenedentes bacterium]|nr:hypothetical protein [Candidatus Hydrogenedentota bacterium]
MRSTRVAWFLLLAGIVFLTGHLLFNGAPAFQGELRVGKTENASIAVHPTDYSSASHPAPADTDSRRYAVQLSDIPFAEPALAEQWIDPRLRYDIVVLPFHLRLTQTAILSPANIASYLEVRPPGAKAKTTKVALTPGQAAHVGAEDLRVDCIRPWGGLLRLPAGRPAASVAVRTPENTWLENLIIEKDSWLYAGADLAIRLVWHDSDQAARAAAESGAPPSEPPRWGVMDGGAINWLDSMTPGTGLQLNSGAKVTLAQVDPSHATEKGRQFAILLQIDQAGERKQEWVIANNPDENAPYRLEYSAARDTLFVLHAARDGFCVVSAYHHYRFAGSDDMSEGET